jgi:hypothetical protein
MVSIITIYLKTAAETTLEMLPLLHILQTKEHVQCQVAMKWSHPLAMFRLQFCLHF